MRPSLQGEKRERSLSWENRIKDFFSLLNILLCSSRSVGITYWCAGKPSLPKKKTPQFVAFTNVSVVNTPSKADHRWNWEEMCLIGSLVLVFSVVDSFNLPLNSCVVSGFCVLDKSFVLSFWTTALFQLNPRMCC